MTAMFEYSQSYNRYSYCFNNPLRFTDPSGFVTVNEYNEGGFLSMIKGKSNNMLWKAVNYNAMGQITQFVVGNSIVVNKGYDVNTGRITRINTTLGNNIFQDLMYSYDDFGNFASISKRNSPVLNESYTYDNFNRLVSSSINGTEYDISYDRYGRIMSKEMPDMTFVGATYHNDKPHALKKYTSYTEPPFSHQSVTYTDFDKVETVSMDENTLQFVYGHDHHRRYMTETVDSVTRSKTYIGNCEFVQSATEGNYALTYLYGPSGIYAVAKKVGDNETLYYVHTDHLGSWNVVTDQYRRIVHQYYFDAWGDAKIVDGDGISVNKPMFDRGFTGHEHHYDFGLINMNGRMYDPYTSMFLSPDNYIQAPDNSQSFNRYAYCLNNPLKYTDPDGEFWHIIAGAAIGGISSYLMANAAEISGKDKFLYTIAGVGVGALTAGIGSSLISSCGFMAGGMISGAVSNASFGCLNGMILGMDSNQLGKYVLDRTWKGAIIGASGGYTFGAIGGGLGAFSAGAVTNGIATLLYGGSYSDAIKSMILGGALGWSSYNLSNLYSFYKADIKNNLNINYRQYANLLKITQKSFFNNKEGKILFNNNGGINTMKLGNEDNVSVSLKLYENAILDYHTHQDFGSKLADGEGFSTITNGGKHSDEFTRIVLTQLNYDLPMALGTREGHIMLYYNPKTDIKTLNFNFLNYFLPYNLFWSKPLKF